MRYAGYHMKLRSSLLRDPALRSRLVEAAHHGVYADPFGPEARRPHFDSLRVLLSPYPDNPTVADEAARRGIDPVEAMIVISLKRNFDVFFAQDLVPQEDELLLSLLRHPRTATGSPTPGLTSAKYSIPRFIHISSGIGCVSVRPCDSNLPSKF